MKSPERRFRRRLAERRIRSRQRGHVYLNLPPALYAALLAEAAKEDLSVPVYVTAILLETHDEHHTDIFSRPVEEIRRVVRG